MPFERINEGLGDLASNIGGAIKTDIMKNSGPWEGIVNSLLSDSKKLKEEMYKDFGDYAVPEFQKFTNAETQFLKSKSGKDINDLIKVIQGLKDTDDLVKFYRWRFYFDTMPSKGKDKVQIEKSKQRITASLINGIDQSKTPIDTSHWDDLKKFVDTMIVDDVNNKRSDYDNVLLKSPKKTKTKTKPIPETKGNYMSFKQFHEAQEKKLKEDNISSLQAKTAQEKKKVADAQKRAADSESKLTQAQLKAQTLQAKQAADAAKTSIKTGMVAEGTYAGGDGIKKKIPFTQNSTLQKQAVGPKDPDAKEKTEEDDELSAAKERIKKLEKLTKELQKAADESNEVATDNIDATTDNLIDKMAAKERDELKEAASDWEKMEAQLKQLDEGCVGGVCTMGGRADAGASGPMGSFGIAPMGQIGGLSMPLPMEQNPVPQVADRSTIYNFVKNNDLHRTNRDFALNALTDKFGNASTELSAILSDAILSDGDPEGIDQSYGYSPDSLLAVQAPPEDEPVNDHIAQATQMSNAWGQMEEKLKDL